AAAAETLTVWYNDLPSYAAGGELHWWNDTVFYEIFVRSFQDGDGDGIGDFAGLTARLDQLNDGDPATDTDLGITGIWLMPINDAPSYHGYDATGYTAINPDYGTLEDFETFLAAAHARGIKVIVDYVMNHCSDQHPWFQASAANDPAYADWFRWSATDPGQTGPWGQQVWHWRGGRWYYGLFTGGMPDLNYDTPAVRDAMFAAADWWLGTVGVDGFRLDAVLYIDEDGAQLQNTAGTLQFWHDFNAHIKAAAPEAMTVGEAWTASTTAVQYVIDDRLDLCFEFDLAYALMGATNGGDAGWPAGKLAQVTTLYPRQQFAPFLTNHDQDRSFTVLGEDPGKAKLAAGMLLMMPGVPFLYYGEEIGMTGSGAHENIRSPMQWTGGAAAGFTTGTPWEPVHADYTLRNVAAQDADPASLRSWYRTLIAARKASPALRRGDAVVLSPSTSAVLAFLRRDPAQTALCVANTADWPVGGLMLDGAAGWLPPGEHVLVNLFDANDRPAVVVDEAGTISGLSLGARQAAAYVAEEVSDVALDPGLVPGAAPRLDPARPNPFNPRTSLRFFLPAGGPVRLAVYDLAGREVARLLDGHLPAGGHEAAWSGADTAGRAAAAGTYVARLDAPGGSRSIKLMLVK
ncbi:MAG TPA: alpha-amylase family glycosyl hydrolase, partial [Candidatus Krumholzibacteria bacterium]|nr:alpha-amylase family glycosyl hydrolase [Candidatus Krumholzibacteria bacterium]